MSSEPSQEQVIPSRTRYLLQVERHLGVPVRLALLVLSFLAWEARPPLWLAALLVCSSVAVSVPALWHRSTGRWLRHMVWPAILVDLALAAVGGLGPAASPAAGLLLVAVVGLRALMLVPITWLPLALVVLLGVTLLPLWQGAPSLSPLEGGAAAVALVVLAAVARLHREAVVERMALSRELALVRSRSAQAEVALRRTADQLARELLALRAIQRSTRNAGTVEALEKLLALIAQNAAQTVGECVALIGVARNGEVEVLARSRDVSASVERALLYLMEQAVVANRPVERPATAALGGPVMIVPLTAEQQPAGALALVGTTARSHFRPDEVERLMTFADQASIAIGQARLYARVMEAKRHAESRLAQLEALNAVARTFVASLDAHRLLADFVRQLAGVLPMTHAAIFLDDGSGGGLWAPVYQWPDDVLSPLAVNDVPELRRALSRGDLVHVLASSASSPLAGQLAHEWGVRGYVIVPLRSRQRPIGVLLVGHAHAELALTPEEAQLVISLASFAAAAVDNLRLYEELDQKSRQLAAIVRDIGDGVIVADAHLRILLVNPAARAIFGLPASPPPDTRLSDLVPSRELADLCRSALTSSGEPQIAELRVRQAGERERTYQALATAVGRDNGTPWGVVTVMRDITTQKELERLKSNFLSVISHELRTPLHSIGGFVDVILMGKTGPINELQRDFLETVKEQAHHLYQLIEDLLEFNRLESGEFRLSPAPVEIGTLIREVVEAMFPVADERNVRLVNTVSVPTATLEGDRKRLRQVFTNLVDNALKFTPAGGSITIRASADADEVVISVQDTGIGIPEEEQRRIFERFYQVDSGLTREHRGTGLGLAIVKHIVEQHGGRIWVESRVNEGSTFFVSLPYTLPKEQLTVDLARLPSPGHVRPE